jgi:transposase-like protein
MRKTRSRKSGESTRRSPEDWAQLMAAYEASDLAQRAFCAEQGVAYSTFCYWRRRLRQEEKATGREGPALVELPVLTSGRSGDWRVELDLGDGLVLRLR